MIPPEQLARIRKGIENCWNLRKITEVDDEVEKKILFDATKSGEYNLYPRNILLDSVKKKLKYQISWYCLDDTNSDNSYYGYLLKFYNIPFHVDYPFLPYYDGYLYCTKDSVLIQLENIGIDISKGFIISRCTYDGIWKILNTHNSRIVTLSLEHEEDEYEQQHIFPKSSIWKDFVYGKSKDLKFLSKEIYSSDILKYCLIKYPHYISMLDQSNIENLENIISLSNLIHKDILPEKYLYGYPDNLPLDALPIPSKDVVEKLDDDWTFFKTAWSILGDYNLPNLKICYEHRELAYRNNKYNENIKINWHQGWQNMKIGDKSMIEIPSLNSIFEMFWEDTGRDEEKIVSLYHLASDIDIRGKPHEEDTRPEDHYLGELHIKPQDCEVIGPERPWHKVFYEINSEIKDFLS